MSLSNIVLPLHSKHKVMEYTLKNGHTLKVLRDEFSDNNPREWANRLKCYIVFQLDTQMVASGNAKQAISVKNSLMGV